jgi:hypothetical protein
METIFCDEVIERARRSIKNVLTQRLSVTAESDGLLTYTGTCRCIWDSSKCWTAGFGPSGWQSTQPVPGDPVPEHFGVRVGP